MEKSVNWDILSLTRFFLAFVVICWHLYHYADTQNIGWFTWLAPFEAVLGFLLISGFSIGTSILTKKEHFFKRRIQRIYPVYFASLVYTAIVTGLYANVNWLVMLLLNMVFLNQVLTTVSYISPAWSLSLEVWLYCLAPLFLKCSKKQLFYLITLSFVSYVAYTCGRSLYDWRYYAGIPYGLILLLLSFIWIAGFRLAVFPLNKKTGLTLVALLLLGVSLLTWSIQIVYRIKNHDAHLLVTDLPALISKSACLLLPFLALVYNHKLPQFKPAFKKLANLLGNISYPLYLTHDTTYKLLKQLGVTNPCIYLIAALLISLMVYYVFDFYSRKRADRLLAAKK